MNRAKYVFRTFAGPWSSILVLGLEVANLVQRGRPWRGELLWTTDWLGIVFFLAGPVIAGFCAVDASRLTRTDVLPVIVVTPRPWRVYLDAVVWTAGPATVLHVVAFAAALSMGIPGIGASNVGWLKILAAFAVQVLAVWWFAALGSAIGRFTTPIAAGITGAGAALIAFYLLSFREGFAPLDLGSATVTRLGLTIDGGYVSLQGLVLAATTGMMFLLGARRDRRFHLADAAVAVAVLGVIGVGMVAGPDSRQVPDRGRPPENCYWGDPVVCLYGEHQRVADVTVGDVLELAEAASSSGYGFLVPSAVHEMSWSYRPDEPEIRGFIVSDEVLTGGRWDQLELVQMLVQPSHCAQLFEGPGPSEEFYDLEESLVFTWLSLLEDPRSAQLEDIADELSTKVLDPEEARLAKTVIDSCNY